MAISVSVQYKYNGGFLPDVTAIGEPDQMP